MYKNHDKNNCCHKPENTEIYTLILNNQIRISSIHRSDSSVANQKITMCLIDQAKHSFDLCQDQSNILIIQLWNVSAAFSRFVRALYLLYNSPSHPFQHRFDSWIDQYHWSCPRLWQVVGHSFHLTGGWTFNWFPTFPVKYTIENNFILELITGKSHTLPYIHYHMIITQVEKGNGYFNMTKYNPVHFWIRNNLWPNCEYIKWNFKVLCTYLRFIYFIRLLKIRAFYTTGSCLYFNTAPMSCQ